MNLRHASEDAVAGLPALMVVAEKAAMSLYSGDHAQRRSGSGEKFWQFREYDPADRPQDIDWRQSAKGDRVFIRQKERQTAQNILFWAQQDRGMTLKSARVAHSKMESAVVISLGLGIMMARAGERVGLMTDPGRTGRSPASLQHLGEGLCRIPDPLSPGPDLPMAVNIPSNSSVVLCGDFLGPPEAIDMTLSVVAARAPQGLLVQILDPAEAYLPFNGRAIFRPFDDSQDFSIANVPSIREAYLQKLHAHIDLVRMIARRHGYAHVLHITRDDIHAALSASWLALSPQLRLQAGGGA